MDTIFIYGVSDCPHCLRACADLMDNDVPYIFIEMDFAKEYRESIKQKFNWTTYPVIVRVKGKEEILIGGYEQLKESMK
jgi:glutaredoxin